MKKGFTLVELLVVIAIIGVLASVAIVNFNAIREKSKKTAMLATIRNLYPLLEECYTNKTLIQYIWAIKFPVFDNQTICSDLDYTYPDPIDGWEYNSIWSFVNDGCFWFIVDKIGNEWPAESLSCNTCPNWNQPICREW